VAAMVLGAGIVMTLLTLAGGAATVGALALAD
jgi:hypothetical protein